MDCKTSNFLNYVRIEYEQETRKREESIQKNGTSITIAMFICLLLSFLL